MRYPEVCRQCHDGERDPQESLRNKETHTQNQEVLIFVEYITRKEGWENLIPKGYVKEKKK